MTHLDIIIGYDEHKGENDPVLDEINIILNGFRFRKNVNINIVAKRINFIYLAELFCIWFKTSRRVCRLLYGRRIST